MHQIHVFSLSHSISICSSSSIPTRRRFVSKPNLKPLTSRIVQLTRRRQLHKILEEIEVAKKRHGKLNTIVMNAVLEACVHCDDIASALKIFADMSLPHGCGVDTISYSTLLKGLGLARRIDEAFQLLESVEQGTATGNPRLSAPLIYGLLDALIEAGDLRRANGLLRRYGFVLREGGNPSVSAYNLLMKGYIKTGHPLAAIAVYKEILRLGLKPDKLTYNKLIYACVKTDKLDIAMHVLEEMKDRAQKFGHDDLFPDVVTYTTLLKGFALCKDLLSLRKIVLEMKSCHNLLVDRTAYTAIVDALLNCDAFKDALCIFGEMLKQAGRNSDLRPKPHLYLSLMRAFAGRGDYDVVKTLHKHMWPDTAGTISLTSQEEADNLLMEAALNDGCSALRGFVGIHQIHVQSSSTASGFQLVSLFLKLRNVHKVSPDEPIESIMIPFEASRPLHGTLALKKVVMRFLRNPVVPIVDDWGSCVGLLHREDCNELDAPLSTMMRSPPPCVTIATSIGHVVDLILEKRYKMVIVVRYSNIYGTPYSSGSRAFGVFTAERLCRLVTSISELPGQTLSVCRRM
ncbi:pentatricopeptide repeat-containing protein At5g10690 isoform X2 [Quercus suber]|uniref:pentatricopeptide repeat-containing protein At5g10690 isoform X2 n=1 Tax=Quercus suber TaxID=58331 RepID=UPI0032DFBA1B